MNTETFFQQFELLADAPNGVAKLRELILQLAVQGKLVSQNPDDEPAADLLERIFDERKEWYKKECELAKQHGRSKPRKPKLKYKDIENIFDIPNSWKFCFFDDIAANKYHALKAGPFGSALKKSCYVQEGYKIYGQEQVISGDAFFGDYYINNKKYLELKSCAVAADDILISLVGTIEKVLILPDNYQAGIINPRLVKLSLYPKIYKPFIEIYLKSPVVKKILNDNSHGGTMNILNLKILKSLSIPLPPIAEQKRIVEKVDRLMELCDKLETQKQQQQTKTLQLGTVATSRLTAAETPEAFKQHWQNISNNFDLIYSTPENIKQLRQTILQLAVMGKLVQQNPDDEPASVLLAKIKAEKEKLIKEGKIKKSKKLKAIAPDEIPFDLPKGWEWVRLNELSKIIEYGTSHKAVLVGAEVPVFRMNNIQNGQIIFDKLKYVPKTIKDLPRLYLNTNDILFNRTNSYELVGKTGVFKDESNKYTFASYLIRASLFVDYVNAEFINSAMNSSYFRQTQIEPEITQQCGQANFNGTKLKNSVIPLPPLAEQHRIVAKVNQIMTYSDELEVKLTQSLKDQEKLMDRAVYQLLKA